MRAHIPVVERITPADRGHGGRRGLRAVARRHAHQDRGGQDRDRRRHPHGHRRRAREEPAAAHRRGRALHLVPDAVQPGHGPQDLDRRRARAARHAPRRRRRRAGAARRREPAAGGCRRASRALSRAAMRWRSATATASCSAAASSPTMRDEAARIIGRPSREIEDILGYPGRAEMVHRDDMALDAG